MVEILTNEIKKDEDLPENVGKSAAYAGFSFNVGANGLLPTSALVSKTVERIYTTATDVTIATTGEQTIFTFDIPANTLETGNIVWIRILLNNLTGDATGTLTTRVKYGGQTGITNAFTPVAQTHHGHLDVYIQGGGSKTAQDVTMQLLTLANQASATGAGIHSQRGAGSFTVSSFSKQTVTITMEWSAVAGGNTISLALGTAIILNT